MSKANPDILQGASEALSYAKGNKRGSKTHKVDVSEKINFDELKENVISSRSRAVFMIKLRSF